jgi:hypothetical protein
VLMGNGWPSMSLPDINDREGHTTVVEMFKNALRVSTTPYPSSSRASCCRNNGGSSNNGKGSP